jgi:hypothetical protein
MRGVPVMNAQLKPVEQPVSCPEYDNTMLGWQDDWIKDNHDALLTRSLISTLGDAVDEADFGLFCRSQHEAELTRRDDYRKTFRQY